MVDWKALAVGWNLGIPEAEVERFKHVMDQLETGFRPLVAKLPPDVEPAGIFLCPPEDAQ